MGNLHDATNVTGTILSGSREEPASVASLWIESKFTGERHQSYIFANINVLKEANPQQNIGWMRCVAHPSSYIALPDDPNLDIIKGQDRHLSLTTRYLCPGLSSSNKGYPQLGSHVG